MSEPVPKNLLDDPPDDPMRIFRQWYAEAEASDEIKYAHAGCLATVDAEGFPEARTILLKKLEDAGFIFFTAGDSPKMKALQRFPEAAFTFYWGLLDRQVRVRGRVEETSDEISDECFGMRPRGSQITTWASRQSRPRGSRADLEERYASCEERWKDEEVVPRPPQWRAYCLVPRSLEFFQARAGRLHDRLLYTLAGGVWEQVWLDP